MSAAWIVAYVALSVLVLLVGLLVLGTLRRLAPLLERTEARLADVAHDLTPQGLAPGEAVPPFEVKRHDGSTFTDADLRGASSLVLFLGVDCRACERLIDDVERSRVPDLGVPVVVATASADQARKLATDPRVEVLIQRGRELSRAFESNVTPHAFVVDARGIVLASGTPNDWERLRLLAVEAIKGGEADSSLTAAVESRASI